jgi:ketopantoate reductase
MKQVEIKKATKTKIAVVGAGAVGSLLGGLLARAGEDVTLVGRRRRARRIAFSHPGGTVLLINEGAGAILFLKITGNQLKRGRRP